MEDAERNSVPTGPQRSKVDGGDGRADTAGGQDDVQPRPGASPRTDEAKRQLGIDLKMAFLHQRDLEEQGRRNFRITNEAWARRVGRPRGNDVVQVTMGHRWPTPDMLHEWDRQSHFDGLLVMRGEWLHHGTWPSATQLAAWDRADHDPYLVWWRRQWFPHQPVTSRALPDAQPDHAQLDDAQPGRRPVGVPRHRPALVATCAVVALVLLAIAVPLVRDRLWPVRRPAAVVSVTAPRAGEDVCYRHTVTGTASHLREEERMWLVVRPALDARVYPQPGGPLVVSSGAWSREAFFGTGTDRGGGAGETFVIDVVGASEDTSARLTAYLTSGYPAGLVQLPARARLLTSVQVRRAAC